MKDRIFQIMKQERLNQKEFAATTGISPATLSSIFNGRTSPTLNHAEALHRRFPNLSMPWLMFGEGEMYIDESKSKSQGGTVRDGQSGDLFTSSTTGDGDGSAEHGDSSEPSFEFGGAMTSPGVIREVVKYIDKPQRKITEIRIFFDDGRYETFPGR